MNFFHASLKTAAISCLICINSASAQIFMNTTKWIGWKNFNNSSDQRSIVAYINFSATVNPYETWTSPDNGNTLKGTVFELGSYGPLKCYEVITRQAAGPGGAVDTKIWTFPGPNPTPVADDPDGQSFAKFVTWGGGQFIITTYSSVGSNSHFQLFVGTRSNITTEADCRNAEPTWSFRGYNSPSRYF